METSPLDLGEEPMSFVMGLHPREVPRKIVKIKRNLQAVTPPERVVAGLGQSNVLVAEKAEAGQFMPLPPHEGLSLE